MRYSLFALLLGAVLFISGGHAPGAAFPALRSATSSEAVISPAEDAGYSYNWAGYEADRGGYSGVWGSWIVPTVGSASWGADATWVGLGGVESDDLLQAGTQAVVSPDGGVEYQAWVEAMPGASHEVPLEVSPGDSVSVSIQKSAPGLWRVSLSNTTTGKKYALSVPYDSSELSAEWIEEAPSTMEGKVLPLSLFGAVRFLGGGAMEDGTPRTIADSGAQALNMVTRRGDLLTQTSVLSEDGGFSVVRTDSAAYSSRSPAQRFRLR